MGVGRSSPTVCLAGRSEAMQTPEALKRVKLFFFFFFSFGDGECYGGWFLDSRVIGNVAIRRDRESND
jgi:hypothetical protein